MSPPGRRQPPQHLSPTEVQAAIDTATASLAPPDPRWVAEAVKTLRAIRDGGAPADARVDGVRLLARVTHDEDGRVNYHLTNQVRELLRRGNGLPWGA